MAKINFEEYVKKLISDLFILYGIKPNNINLSVNIESIEFDIYVAVPCGLIISELISNSIKYAFTGINNSMIKISITEFDENYYILLVEDNGTGLPKGFDIDKIDSLGIKLVRLLTKQINGHCTIWNEDGVKCQIMIPKIRP